jgi:hypothetical protein
MDVLRQQLEQKQAEQKQETELAEQKRIADARLQLMQSFATKNTAAGGAGRGGNNYSSNVFVV